MISRLVRAGLTTGAIDGLFASVLAAFVYGSTVTRLWQGVASTLLGPSAFEGGNRATVIGLLMPVGVAFACSAVFVILFASSSWIRGLVGSLPGVIAVAAVYGPLIWIVMSFAIVPLLTHRPPAVNIRWWIQLIGHIPFVGLPIVWMIGRS